jgi:hypothetical protein
VRVSGPKPIDRQHHRGELGLADHPPHDRRVDHPTDRCGQQHRAHQTGPETQPQRHAEPQGEERPQHQHVALGEVDDLGRLVDQHEAERDQPVDAARRQPGDQDLKGLGHGRAPPAIAPARTLGHAMAA